MSEKIIRVCIIEDHAMVRAGLRMLIENNDGMSVVGEAANRIEAFECARKSPPDIFILDLDLKDESGLDFLPDLISTYTDARVLVLTSATDTEAHHQAIEAGAMGLVLKGEAAEVLIHAIRRVHAGEVWMTRSLTASVLTRISHGSTDDAESKKIASLTKREREIIALIAHGFKRSQIADSLFISETTVRNHLTSILSKLELADRFELVFYAYRNGLAKPPRGTSA
jgi:DNA-binding NarL/FixJ family response regulator